MPLTPFQIALGIAAVGTGGYFLLRKKSTPYKPSTLTPEGAPGPEEIPPPPDLDPFLPKPDPGHSEFEPPFPPAPPPPVPTPLPVPPVFKPQPGPWPPTGPGDVVGLPCPVEESLGSVLSTAARFYIPQTTDVALFSFKRTGCVYDLVLNLCIQTQHATSMGEVDYWADLGQPPPEVLNLTDGEGFVGVKRLRLPFAWRKQVQAKLYVSENDVSIHNVVDFPIAEKDPEDLCLFVTNPWPLSRGSDIFLVGMADNTVKEWKSEPQISLVSTGLDLGFEVEVGGLPYFFKLNGNLRSYDTHTSQFKIAYQAQVAPA